MIIEKLFPGTKLYPHEILCPVALADYSHAPLDMGNLYYSHFVPEALEKYNVCLSFAEAQRVIGEAINRFECCSGELWLYSAIAYFDWEGLRPYDIFSAARLLTYVITGWYSGFGMETDGTETYEKERIIEGKWRSLQSMLVSLGCKAEAMARIAVIFITDQYAE